MTGGMNRFRSRMKALRKMRLYPTYYGNLHQYSKNKIHCSCPLCCAKTRIHGWKISDRRRLDKLEYEKGADMY